MDIQPTEDRIIVEPTSPERKLASGLIIPETAENASQDGIVTAVGPDVETFVPGDHVIYSKFGGTEVEYQGETLLILRRVDILAKIPPPAEEGKSGGK